MTDLESIEVYRAVGPSPAVTAPRRRGTGGAAGDRAPGAGERGAAQSERLAEQAFYTEAALVERLRMPALAPLTHGATLRYEDPLMPLIQGRPAPVPVAYSIVAVRRNQERSPLSNIAVLSPAVPPAAPTILRLVPEQGRVCVEWLPVESDVLGAALPVGGYRVYRRVLPEEVYGAPLNPDPISDTSFVDSGAPYGELAYTVRATHPEKKNVEGLPAEEAVLSYRDLFPPSAPARVDALPEGNLVRLLWDPVDAPDLAGYLLFRAEESGARVQLTPNPIADTFFTDESSRHGVRYRYTVVAVDVAGNRSAPSPEATAEPF